MMIEAISYRGPSDTAAAAAAAAAAAQYQVVEVGHDDRGPKIGCSMKLVDQADGTDLDPQVGLRA
jgi:hypothetical protein